MPETPYTPKTFIQYRGPQYSDEYNSRLEDNYKDLVYLYNKQHQTDADIQNGFSAFVKDLQSVTNFIQYLTQRIEILESQTNILSFNDVSQIDTSSFDGTDFQISEVDRCTFHPVNSSLTLPKVDSSSMSKIKFSNQDGSYSIAPSLEVLVTGISGTMDDNINIVDTSQPLNAILGRPGKVWERNVLIPNTSSPDLTDGAQMYLYIKIPLELSVTEVTNCISFTPFPLKNIDILDISYTTDTAPTLDPTANWVTFNNNKSYFQVGAAVGKIAPGAWDGDEIIDSSSKVFYFDPKPITAVRFHIRQRNYYDDAEKYIYTYGMSKLDIRFDKFIDAGKTIIKFDAPVNTTINSVTSVQPQVWNVPEYLIDNIFSYRVLWQTETGTFTTQPVSQSSSVWVEVTLTKTPAGGTPVLSGLLVSYT